MNKVCLLAVIVLLGAVFTLFAERSPAADKADDDGWISLFDGKTLAGWKANEKPKQWKVEDGAIVAAGPRSHLFYVGDDENNPPQFESFRFKADVMTTKGSNSGIYFHTEYLDKGWPVKGHESQVNVTHGDPVKTGSLYGIVKLYETPAKDNQWWTQTIIVRGQNIVIKINGKTVIDYTEPQGIKGLRKLVAKSEPKRSSCDINEIIDEVIDLIRADARFHAATIEVLNAYNRHPVLVDKVQIQQVLVNLVHNAVQAMADIETANRLVLIEASTSGDNAVEVAVRDFGPVCSADLLERIFEPFFSTKSEGLGIGLSISRSIIEAHGGRLTASANTHRGTTFRFTLPNADGAH